MAYELEFTNQLDPTLSGEATAQTLDTIDGEGNVISSQRGWIYEGTADLSARDRFNGETFNRPAKLIMTNLLELKDFVLTYVNTKFTTEHYADGSITYAKLASEVKAKFKALTGEGTSGGNYTMVARRLQMFTRVHNKEDAKRSVLQMAINARKI